MIRIFELETYNIGRKVRGELYLILICKFYLKYNIKKLFLYFLSDKEKRQQIADINNEHIHIWFSKISVILLVTFRWILCFFSLATCLWKRNISDISSSAGIFLSEAVTDSVGRCLMQKREEEWKVEIESMKGNARHLNI